MKTLVQVGGEGTAPRYDSSQEQEAGRDSCGREAFKGPHWLYYQNPQRGKPSTIHLSPPLTIFQVLPPYLSLGPAT